MRTKRDQLLWRKATGIARKRLPCHKSPVGSAPVPVVAPVCLSLASVVKRLDAAQRRPRILTEVRNAMQGMRNVISGVNRLLTNGRPSEALAAAAEALKQKAIDALLRAQEPGVTRR